MWGDEYAGINWVNVGSMSDAGINWWMSDVMSECGDQLGGCGCVE